MINRKKIIIIFFVIMPGLYCFAYDKKTDISVTASTSWTAAFADLAGVDNIKVIAPADLKHPPEYEITVNDILTVSKSDYFIYAGFERMMETLGNVVNGDKINNSLQMIKIKCDNSVDTVRKNAEIISKIVGTEEESKKRVEKYVSCIAHGRKAVASKGFAGAAVFCHKHQVFLAKELGFKVVGVFGPGPVTSKQIADAKINKYDFIIDNIHNPVGVPLSEVASDSKYIIWRNFPDKIEKDSLLHVVQQNIDLIF